MSAENPRRFKSVSLTLRGFDLTPEGVESIAGVVASKKGSKGMPAKPGVKTLLNRSFVQFSVDFPGGCRLNEMIPALVTYLGGMAHICDFRDQVAPEFFEVHIVLPIKGSEEQEGGFLSPAMISDLCLLRATLTFAFL